MPEVSLAWILVAQAVTKLAWAVFGLSVATAFATVVRGVGYYLEWRAWKDDKPDGSA